MKFFRVLLTFLCITVAIPLGGCSTSDENVTFLDTVMKTTSLVEAEDSDNTIVEISFWADRVIETRSLTETDESVFYISKAGIERYDKANESTTVLVESTDIKLFNIDSGFVFYCENYSVIYCVDLEGANQRRILSLDDIDESIRASGFSNVVVYQEFVYFSFSVGSYSYYRYNMQSREIEMFAYDAVSCFYCDNYLYYIEKAGKSFSIFRKDLATNQIELLRGDGEPSKDKPYSGVPMIDGIFLVDGQIFYTTRFPAAVFRLEDDGDDVMISDFERPENRDRDFANACIGLHNLYFGNTYDQKDILYEYNPTTCEIKEYYTPTDTYYWREAKVVNGYFFYIVSVSGSRSFIEYFQLSI